MAAMSWRRFTVLLRGLMAYENSAWGRIANADIHPQQAPKAPRAPAEGRIPQTLEAQIAVLERGFGVKESSV